VWGSASRWPIFDYYDGRLISADVATSLVGDMLAGAEFWCRLVTDVVEVHVAEQTVYVWTSGLGLDELGVLAAELVDSSPYAIDRAHFPYYPAADEEFWGVLRKHVDSGAGEMLILQQWAAGFGGERWHYVTSATDLDAVRRDVVPRALFAAFQGPRLVRRRRGSDQRVDAVLGIEPSLAGIRIFRKLGESPLMSVEHVADGRDLARAWESLDDGSFLFLWDDDAVASYAAQPDADGRVRVAASFQ
jgi:hypothetical protein